MGPKQAKPSSGSEGNGGPSGLGSGGPEGSGGPNNGRPNNGGPIDAIDKGSKKRRKASPSPDIEV
ncbi:hypothetical protein EG329_006799 [Mollisiaceae sp. DMI_Dod_QoI]|nr:hypothetical protein EG329_006799 [Helotiales sp. DMI_Dod_QoI]